MSNETTEIEDKVHAKRGPSAADRHTVCFASAALEPHCENKTSIYAAWGTVAHEIAALILQAFADCKGRTLGDAEVYVGRLFTVEGFEIEVDMEMADCVNDYTAHVTALIDPQRGDHLMVEVAAPVGNYTLEEGGEGTSDAVGIIEGGRELVVVDLKGGAGVLVGAENNSQLRLYGLGTLDKVDLIFPDIERVRLVIVQPRKNQYDEEVIEIDDFRAIGEELKTLYAKCNEAEAIYAKGGAKALPLALYSPGEKQCKFCSAKNICGALANEVEDVITDAAGATEFEDLTKADKQTVEGATLANLSRYMTAIPMIEDWCKAIRAEVFDRLTSGDEIEGFKLVRGRRGGRAWTSEEDFFKALGNSRVNSELLYSQKLLSPAQMEKTVGKEKPRIWKKLQDVVHQPEGGVSVAPEDDKREPVKVADAAADFADISDGSNLIG